MGLGSFNGNGHFSTRNLYKSEGERRIARMLDEVGIDYIYEPGLLVNDGGKNRIYYPDFQLPHYAVYIEYFGIENDPSYDARTEHKMDVYQQNKIDVVPVYPGTLRGDYRGHVLGEVHRIQQARLADLENRIYNRNPRQAYRRSFSQLGLFRFSGGYR